MSPFVPLVAIGFPLRQPKFPMSPFVPFVAIEFPVRQPKFQ